MRSKQLKRIPQPTLEEAIAIFMALERDIHGAGPPLGGRGGWLTRFEEQFADEIAATRARRQSRLLGGEGA